MDGSSAQDDAIPDARTQRLRAASRTAFAAALLLPALATVAGLVGHERGARIVGTLLLPLLAGAMFANLLAWSRPLAEKARIYLAVGLLFAVWSLAEVVAAWRAGTVVAGLGP